jgi:hypothetical protein
MLSFFISIISIFARHNWRHLHNSSERELVCLVYPVDTAKELHLIVYTYFALLQLTTHVWKDLNMPLPTTI